MAKRELKNTNIDENVVEEKVEEVVEPTEEVVDVAPEVTEVKKTICTGVVFKCSHLNIRKKASANGEVVRLVDAGSKLTIDMDKSNDEWLKVTTADNVKGYCMKKYVNIDQ